MMSANLHSAGVGWAEAHPTLATLALGTQLALLDMYHFEKSLCQFRFLTFVDAQQNQYFLQYFLTLNQKMLHFGQM